MFRKLLCSVFVFTVGIGLVAAEEFTARITKVEGDKITFQKFKKGEKGKAPETDGEPVTLPVAKDAKILKGSFGFGKDAKKETEPLEGGLKNEVFTKIGEKGMFARITTADDDKSITQIVAITFGGFKKKKKTDN